MDIKIFYKWMLILILICGCSQFYYQSPLTKFRHEEHVDSLFKGQKDCSYCHKLPAIDKLIRQEGEFQIASDFKKAASEIKLEGQCHSCHKDAATKVATATKTCTTCHEYLKAMKPDDHVNNWKQRHSVPAALDGNNCRNCHKDWYCASCHSQQKKIGRFMHARTYRLRHALDAKVDPASCDACHRLEFCLDCHLKD